MNPTSLPIASSAATAVISAGYHVINGDKLIEPERTLVNIRGRISNAGIIDEINEITNHGTIWTKRIVLSVAKCADLEVTPIHMPNQHKAIRLPAVARVAAEANRRAKAI